MDDKQSSTRSSIKIEEDLEQLKSFNSEAVEKSGCCTCRITSDGCTGFFMAWLSATIRLLLNLYAAYSVVSAANKAAHTCPEQRQRLDQASFGLDQLRTVDSVVGDTTCTDSPAVTGTRVPLNWFEIDYRACNPFPPTTYGRGSSECTLRAGRAAFAGDPTDSTDPNWSYLNYDATFMPPPESQYLCLKPWDESIAVAVFLFMCAMTGSVYLIEMFLTIWTYNPSFVKARFHYIEVVGNCFYKFVSIFPLLGILFAYVLGLYMANTMCRSDVEDVGGHMCACPSIPSFTDDNFITSELGWGNDKPKECPITSDMCTEQIQRFFTSSLFSLLFYCISTHAGVKHFRTTLKYKRDIKNLPIASKSMVYANIDLVWPFIHVKEQETIIADCQELKVKNDIVQTVKQQL